MSARSIAVIVATLLVAIAYACVPPPVRSPDEIPLTVVRFEQDPYAEPYFIAERCMQVKLVGERPTIQTVALSDAGALFTFETPAGKPELAKLEHDLLPSFAHQHADPANWHTVCVPVRPKPEVLDASVITLPVTMRYFFALDCEVVDIKQNDPESITAIIGMDDGTFTTARRPMTAQEWYAYRQSIDRLLERLGLDWRKPFIECLPYSPEPPDAGLDVGPDTVP